MYLCLFSNSTCREIVFHHNYIVISFLILVLILILIHSSFEKPPHLPADSIPRSMLIDVLFELDKECKSILGDYEPAPEAESKPEPELEPEHSRERQIEIQPGSELEQPESAPKRERPTRITWEEPTESLTSVVDPLHGRHSGTLHMGRVHSLENLDCRQSRTDWV